MLKEHKKYIYRAVFVALCIGLSISSWQKHIADSTAIYESDIVYETPNYTESFDRYKGKWKRYDVKVLYVAQEGKSIVLKWKEDKQ